jgi:hypothetical protein
VRTTHDSKTARTTQVKKIRAARIPARSQLITMLAPLVLVSLLQGGIVGKL